MNLSQTGFLLGEPRRHLIMLILHQTIRLLSVACIKDLGVFIDCDLSFRKNNNAYFASDNNAMSSVSCIKDLDVFIDCDLSFSNHIDDITGRAYDL